MRALLLALFASAAIAAEVPLTPPLYGPAADAQYAPVAASDGDGYLVVWTDKRATEPKTFATRVTRDGEVLDKTGIALLDAEMYSTQVLWTGTSYLVVWEQSNTMWALRIDRDGKIVDGPRTLVHGATPTGLATDGSQIAIGFRSAGSARVLFLTPDGETVAHVLLGAGDIGPTVASGGGSFAALWMRAGTIVGTRFNSEGPIDAAPRTLFGDFIYGPRIASDGVAFVVVSRADWLAGMYAARRISFDLANVGAATLLPEQIYSNASVLWTGSHYVVVGDFGAITSGVRLGREAQLLDAHPILIEEASISGTAASPSVATNGRELFISWTGTFAYEQEASIEIYGTRTQPSLARLSRSVLSVSAVRQTRPVVARGKDNLLAVWNEGTGLWAKRLAFDGSPVDASPVRLTTAPTVAAVAFNGTDYIVAWKEQHEVATIRVHADGTLRTSGGGRAPTNGYVIALASSGTTTTLAWGGYGLNASRLRADGSFLDTVPLVVTEKIVGAADLAPNNIGTFLIVWGELEFVDPFYDTPQPIRVRAARLTPALNLAGEIDIANTSAFEGEPSVAWNGHEWLVVWTEARTVIVGRRVTANGTLDGPDALITPFGMNAEVVWDGARYLVTWLNIATYTHPKSLRAAWLPRLGAPLIGERELGIPERWPPSSIAAAAIRPGEVATVYARLAPEPQYGGVPRAFLDIFRFTTRRRAVR